MILLGESAGGHLAADFAISKGTSLNGIVGGVVTVGAPLDFLDYWYNASGNSHLYENANRSMSVGGVSIPVPVNSSTLYSPTIFGFLRSYYWNSGRRTGEFGAANPFFDPVILPNSLDLNVSSTTLPFYLVTTNVDAMVAPEQSLQLCAAFGTPAMVSNTSTYKRARCGSSTRNTWLDIPLNLTGSGSHMPLEVAPSGNATVNALYVRLAGWMAQRILQ
jgi:hypothetical protein